MNALLLFDNKHNIFQAIIVFILAWVRIYINTEIQRYRRFVYISMRALALYILYEWKLIVLYEPLMVTAAD